MGFLSLSGVMPVEAHFCGYFRAAFLGCLLGLLACSFAFRWGWCKVACDVGS